MATRTVKYLGPLYAVEMITGLTFVRDVDKEVEDTIAESLIEGFEGPPAVLARPDDFEEVI